MIAYYIPTLLAHDTFFLMKSVTIPMANSATITIKTKVKAYNSTQPVGAYLLKSKSNQSIIIGIQ